MKILLIEDNESNRKLVKRIVNKAGYFFLEAGDAQRGIELAGLERPALILMDMNLPGMDGLTATKILKQNPDTSLIPVIAFTAYAMKGDREAMIAAGCDDYISKPISYNDFVDKLNKWLEPERSKSTDSSDSI